MNYHLSDTPLRLREFGRNIQNMVEYACTLPDRQVRTQTAHEIIRYMIMLNPSLKENPDHKQKLWDALYMMSDFKLDVDAPYPPPGREVLYHRTGKHMGYSRNAPQLRQYGFIVEQMIRYATDMEEGPRKTAYVNHIANIMKMFLRAVDRDGNVPEAAIADHIRILSKNRLTVRPEDIVFSRQFLQAAHSFTQRSFRTAGQSSSKQKRNQKRRRR
jgi:hypothetical protein